MQKRTAAFANPFERFSSWMAEAEALKQMPSEWSNAMTLATFNPQTGFPSCRVVLCQFVRNENNKSSSSPAGFYFYTNYSSSKGNDELAQHQKASALFYWNKISRQVRIEGIVERASAEDSDAYWASRPRESKIVSIASKQSQELPGGTEQLLAEIAQTKLLFEKKLSTTDNNNDDGDGNTNSNNTAVEELPIERPEHLGLFVLKPIKFEFWKDAHDGSEGVSKSRMHEREVFQLVENNQNEESSSPIWELSWLYP